MFEIRRGMPEDAEKIIKYLKIIGTETDNLTFDGGISITVEQEREYLNMVYNSSRSLYLIAVENDEVIGCASLDTSLRERLKHRGSLGVSVQKKAWGKHIGSRLMEELLKFAKDTAGLEIIMLEVRSGNERAINLYKKFGFKKLCTLEGYMKIKGELTDCDLMMLKL